MPPRDEHGRFIGGGGSESEPEPEAGQSVGWVCGGETQVFVETGRGNSVPVETGQPFQQSVERVAEQANYGGNFRVFLNGSEIIDPASAPAIIEPGMRIALTPYDKVG